MCHTCIHVYKCVECAVTDAVKERLDALSASTGRPATFYVRQAVTEYLDELEYVYTLQAEVEDARRGELATRPLSELVAEMGLTRADIDAALRYCHAESGKSLSQVGVDGLHAAGGVCDVVIDPAGRYDNRTPVKHGVMQCEQRRFLPTVRVHAAGEAGHRLVCQLPGQPQRACSVQEMLQRYADRRGLPTCTRARAWVGVQVRIPRGTGGPSVIGVGGGWGVQPVTVRAWRKTTRLRCWGRAAEATRTAW